MIWNECGKEMLVRHCTCGYVLAEPQTCLQLQTTQISSQFKNMPVNNYFILFCETTQQLLLVFSLPAKAQHTTVRRFLLQ